MKRLITVAIIIASFAALFSGLFGLNKLPSENIELIGTEKGLFTQEWSGHPECVWKKENANASFFEIKKILPLDYGFFLLTSDGIIFTEDLRNFQARNNGLSFKHIKYFDGSNKSFSNEIQDLKDLESDPANSSNLITCSKDNIFYSTDAGENWHSLPNPTKVPGIKAVAIYSNPHLTILVGHAFKGLYRKTLTPDTPWREYDKGLLEYSGAHEEISDILAYQNNGEIEIALANNFTPIIYSLDQKHGEWKTILRLNKEFDQIESLNFNDNKISFLTMDGFRSLDTTGKAFDAGSFCDSFIRSGKPHPQSACIIRSGKVVCNLSDLWLIRPPQMQDYAQKAASHKGIYTAAGYVRNKGKLDKLTKMMEKNGLNMMVIDMKDDWGNLRFVPKSELVKKIGKSAGAIDLETFTPSMKAKGIYLVARMVLFQDRVMYSYNNFESAIKDKTTGSAWQGIKKNKDGTTKPILEYWVDPYSEKAWEYNVAIARELIERGFDEIQFDYVRFPTDGENLEDTSFSFRDPGMDKESAIMSFLIYARQNIPAPISIDIYGANGWWRTSARTGQDVELFRRYVDAICPMFYPSHFAPEFLYFEPYEARTYRIYYYGSLRNLAIAKNSIVIRPYVQAFNLHTAFDRKYYGLAYISNEIKGVNDSIALGYTFWNMGMQYGLLDQIYQSKDSTNLSR